MSRHSSKHSAMVSFAPPSLTGIIFSKNCLLLRENLDGFLLGVPIPVVIASKRAYEHVDVLPNLIYFANHTNASGCAKRKERGLLLLCEHIQFYVRTTACEAPQLWAATHSIAPSVAQLATCREEQSLSDLVIVAVDTPLLIGVKHPEDVPADRALVLDTDL